jgi:hypothetical protein
MVNRGDTVKSKLSGQLFKVENVVHNKDTRRRCWWPMTQKRILKQKDEDRVAYVQERMSRCNNNTVQPDTGQNVEDFVQHYLSNSTMTRRSPTRTKTRRSSTPTRSPTRRNWKHYCLRPGNLADVKLKQQDQRDQYDYVKHKMLNCNNNHWDPRNIKTDDDDLLDNSIYSIISQANIDRLPEYLRNLKLHFRELEQKTNPPHERDSNSLLSGTPTVRRRLSQEGTPTVRRRLSQEGTPTVRLSQVFKNWLV